MIVLTPHNQLSYVITQTVGSSEAITNIPNPSTVSIQPTGGEALAEYTLDPTLTEWHPWAKGSVTTYTDDVLVADVIALRVTVASGSAVMTIVGGRRG